VCARDEGTDPLLLREERLFISDVNTGVEAKLRDCCSCTICTCRFVVTTMIIRAGWLGLHVEKSVCFDRDVTRYEREGRRSCINIGGDRMICYWSFRFGAGTLGTGRISKWRRLRGGEDFKVVKSSER